MFRKNFFAQIIREPTFENYHTGPIILGVKRGSKYQKILSKAHKIRALILCQQSAVTNEKHFYHGYDLPFRIMYLCNLNELFKLIRSLPQIHLLFSGFLIESSNEPQRFRVPFSFINQ